MFFRSDESGTTENFTKYLKAAAPTHWTAEPGKKWTGKGEGKEKSAGVAEAVKATDGGITYVEWSYAKDNELGIAQVDNGGGAVELTAESVGKAVAGREAGRRGQRPAPQARLRDQGGRRLPDPPRHLRDRLLEGQGRRRRRALVKAFLKHFASTEMQKGLEEIGYAPLPAEVQSKVDDRHRGAVLTHPPRPGR